MTRKNYPSDLTDEEWKQLKKYLPAGNRRGRPPKWEMRTILNAIIYVVKTGCQWRQLPHDFPPWQTVYYHFRKWSRNQTWLMIHQALHEQTRVDAQRSPTPTAAIIDSQSVKTTELAASRGFDGHKKVKGRKRHIATDTLGYPLLSFR